LIRCGPCKFIGPIFEKLAAEHPEAEFVKVDVDDADDVAAAVGIQAMPTFHFYKGGVKVDEMQGADQAKLVQLVMKNK
jgi:thioredoxin 1